MRILLAEDEPSMAALVGDQLRGAGYLVDCVASIQAVLDAVAASRHDLLLLDRRLPDGDSIAMLAAIRRHRAGVPIMILTALDELTDKVVGLDAGADDYLTKPFARDELLARIRALLRRPGGALPPPIVLGRLCFDLTLRQASIGGTPVRFTRRETALIESLIRRAGRVVPREMIIEEIYGFDDEVQPNAIDAHVSRLRGTLKALQAGVTIHPVRGVGYLLDVVTWSAG